MAQGKIRNLNDGFTDEEEKIVDDFLAGKTIRAIEKESKFGRTAIRNIIEAYKTKNPEFSEKIDSVLFVNKNHNDKNITDVKEISEEEIIKIYNNLISGNLTLRQASVDVGRTREYIKKRISNFLNDEKKFEEFLNKLKGNQAKLKELNSFMALSDDWKEDVIFEKLIQKKEKTGKFIYKNYLFLDKKLINLKDYFLVDRNNEFDTQCFTEDEFWAMLYDVPDLITYSLSNKIKPAMRNLDKHEHIGPANATKIIVEDASILASSIYRTNLQIKILIDYNMLDMFLRKPKFFRTSPELIYGFAKFAEDNDKDIEEIMLAENRLKNKYGINKQYLKDTYNSKEKYGDYEYFKN